MNPIPLTSTLLSTFKVTKAFGPNRRHLTSLSYDDTGEFCITAAEDESLKLYNCRDGTLKTTLYSRKYGVGLARFTHQASNVIYGSTKEDDTLRYLSLHDNKYIRYFRGHKKRVISLEMSPADDQFISSSLDGTVRLWDLRSPNCQGMIDAAGRPIASIDNAGLVFGVGLDSQVLRLYDIRKFHIGPFATWTVTDPLYPQGTPEWTSIKFTNDGQHILLTTTGNVHYVLDAYNGHVERRLIGSTALPQVEETEGKYRCGEEVGLSPDAKFVLAGGQDGVVRVWDLSDNNQNVGTNGLTTILDTPVATELYPPHGHATGSIDVLGFNPSLMMMASGGNELVSTIKETIFFFKKKEKRCYPSDCLVTIITIVLNLMASYLPLYQSSKITFYSFSSSIIFVYDTHGLFFFF
ncbi:WD40-repeat-containing domain protein [Halteromyces radiatus]|uniref:WD40-repeat-containing domain protein n=1 Tax=Halteromyces radiatus TaxID=101107 RepID=UPI0022209C9B|nr:WD40-repeat-containing domain protein [Halteromyces radiatus]KAI8097277.1 WD40-repeat-containing domain protein [Halteromyces radiatus]